MKDFFKNNKKIIFWIFTSIVIAIILYFRFSIFYFFVSNFFVTKTNDKENDEKIKTLHPLFAYRVSKFIKELESQGKKVIVTSAYRDAALQGSLGSGAASPMRSYHNYGLAIDINVDGLKMASSKNSWLNSGVVDTAKKYGLRWGGYFSGNYDPVHFDMGDFVKMDDLFSLYENKKLLNNKFIKLWSLS